MGQELFCPPSAMNNQTVYDLMDVATWVLQLAILIGMYRRRLTREYRVFFAYTAFTFCQTVLQFSIRNHFGFYSKEYFVAYWLGFVVHISLMFFIIQDVYAKVLFRYRGLRTVSAVVFRWAFMLLVVLSIVSALTSPAADGNWIYSSILKIDFGARLVEFGLIALLFIFARALALSWKEVVFGISVGTCFYCSAELAATALRTHLGREFALALSFLTPALGIISLGIWTSYVYRAELQRRIVLKPANPQLEEWDRAVLHFLNR